MLPPLSVPDTITILRAKYPDALICTACAVLLATRPESYAKSNLTEHQRLAYVCAECKLDQTETDRVKGLRAEIGRRNIVHAQAARRAQKGTSTSPVRIDESSSIALSDPRVNSGDSTRVNVTREGARRGGRPRVHPTNSVAHREAQRAYRERRRAQQVPA
jgi:hypothetical protein